MNFSTVYMYLRFHYYYDSTVIFQSFTVLSSEQEANRVASFGFQETEFTSVRWAYTHDHNDNRVKR